MPGFYNAGAVYNWYLRRLAPQSTEELMAIIIEWEKKSRMRKFLAHLTTDWEMKLKATKDLLEAQLNPTGDVAKRIDWVTSRRWHARN